MRTAANNKENKMANQIRYFFIGETARRPLRICKTIRSAARWAFNAGPSIAIWARHSDGSVAGPWSPSEVDLSVDVEVAQ
jgi:hypothetical protein